MTIPLRLLSTGVDAAAHLSDEACAAFGPFALQPCETLAALALHASRAAPGMPDAVLAGVADAADLLAWPALTPTALATALVLVLPEVTPALQARLLAAGVQEVLSAAEAAEAPRLARTLRAAVERKRLEIATRRAYATDLSTGLPNHPQLLEHMTHLLALREREPAPMALIVLKLQGLARTEAALGPEAANVLRRKAAVRLRSGLRASDVVASIGMDAFAVLLAWIDAPQDGDRVAAKLAAALGQPFSVAGREQKLAVSAGLASYPAHGKDADTLLHRALAQAATLGVETAGSTGARAADRGPDAAANDDV